MFSWEYVGNIHRISYKMIGDHTNFTVIFSIALITGQSDVLNIPIAFISEIMYFMQAKIQTSNIQHREIADIYSLSTKRRCPFYQDWRADYRIMRNTEVG